MHALPSPQHLSGTAPAAWRCGRRVQAPSPRARVKHSSPPLCSLLLALKSVLQSLVMRSYASSGSCKLPFCQAAWQDVQRCCHHGCSRPSKTGGAARRTAVAYTRTKRKPRPNAPHKFAAAPHTGPQAEHRAYKRQALGALPSAQCIATMHRAHNIGTQPAAAISHRVKDVVRVERLPPHVFVLR